MERGERKKSAVSPGGFATPLGNGYNNCSGRQWCWTRRQAAQPKRSLWNTALTTRQTPIYPFQDTWTIHLNGSRPGHRRNLDKHESMDIQQTIFSDQNAAPLGRSNVAQQKLTWAPWRHGFDPWPGSVSQGSAVAMSCGVGRRCSSDTALLGLRRRLAPAAPVDR